MKAPVYSPAVAFEQPAVQPFELRVKNLPLAELKSDPAVWSVVIKHMPEMKMIASASFIRAQLGNMTLLDFGVFGNPDNPAFALIDDDLKRLPARVNGAK